MLRSRQRLAQGLPQKQIPSSSELPVIMRRKTSLQEHWEHFPRLNDLVNAQLGRIEETLGGITSACPRAGDDLRDLITMAIFVGELELAPPPPPEDRSSLEEAMRNCGELRCEVEELREIVNDVFSSFTEASGQKLQDMAQTFEGQFALLEKTHGERLRKESHPEGKDRL